MIRELGPQFTPPLLALQWSGETICIRSEYFAALNKLVDPSILAEGDLRILYTAMHGCGAGWLDGYLTEAGVTVHSLATDRDPYFGGRLPDPSPANLTPLAQAAREGGYNLVVGTDGDADRFGLVDPKGNYFSANHALPLLADYLIKAKGRSGALVRTVATSELVDAVAKEHKLPLIETKVGFKYIADELRKGALIGAEESGGISIQGHVPEKDGILATLLMLEMMADTGTGLHELLQQTMDRLGHRYYTRVDLVMPDEAKARLLNALKDESFTEIASRRIAAKKTIDGVKLSFADGCWAMIRPSGTEPVVRVYMEALDIAELENMAAVIEQEIGVLAGQAIHRAAH
ncbi:MAG: hypothetical protein M3R04_04260 [bacterium]|nr:hypothetical protein [bacterium]